MMKGSPRYEVNPSAMARCAFVAVQVVVSDSERASKLHRPKSHVGDTDRVAIDDFFACAASDAFESRLTVACSATALPQCSNGAAN
jgi:hypothetical protein